MPGPGQEDWEGGRREEAVHVLSPAAVRTGGTAAAGCAAPLGPVVEVPAGPSAGARASAGGEAQPATGAASRFLEALASAVRAFCLSRF